MAKVQFHRRVPSLLAWPRSGEAHSAGPVHRIEVTDNGIGISPEQAERVFGLFQRLHTREEYEGSGMGLAICKKIVERHGGPIAIRPSTGPGTTVCVELPSEFGHVSRRLAPTSVSDLESSSG